MKKLLSKLSKKNVFGLLSSASVGMLTLMLVSVANSASCFYIHQPKEPKAVEDFKWIH